MTRAAKPQGSPKGEPAKSKGEAAKPHEVLLMPAAQNAIAMEAWGQYAGKADLAELVTDLREQTDKMKAGSMGSVESMLYGQAMTLQTIFTSLARRSAMNAGEYMDAADKYMRLALKAQAQCRATLETLAEIKNPTPYIMQANIANGPQQVNNGANQHTSIDASTTQAQAAAGELRHQYAQARPHAGDSQTLQNKLLEHQHGNTLEFGAQGQTVGTDTHLEAVGTVQRATHPGRQGRRVEERLQGRSLADAARAVTPSERGG